MKTRIVLLFFILSISSGLFAQKARIDPYLSTASRAYGKGQNPKGRTLGSPNAAVLRQSLQAAGIEADKNGAEWRINVLLEFDGDVGDLEKLGVNLRTKVGNIYTADLPIDRLEQIREVSGMKVIETARLAETELDASRQDGQN
ncbi:MAG: hypothetical protein OXH57_10175 [Ekhidna sp.]|nr:hypothetical protein [Ekhidna sp.]